MLAKARELSSKLLGKKVVKVKTGAGDEVEFEIQRVSIEKFAGEGGSKMENIIGKSQDEIRAMFLDKFKSQEISTIISPVLLEGISNPSIVNKEVSKCNLEEEIPIKVLLLDLELATNLYTEILQISIEKK